MFSLQQTPLLTLHSSSTINKGACVHFVRAIWGRKVSWGVEGSGLLICHLTKIYSYFYFYCYGIYSIRINTRISKECVTIHCCYDILCTALFKSLVSCAPFILSTCPSKGLCTALPKDGSSMTSFEEPFEAPFIFKSVKITAEFKYIGQQRSLWHFFLITLYFKVQLSLNKPLTTTFASINS